jgi:hypothetical protein
VAKLEVYPGIVLEGLKKTMKIISQDSRCPSQDSKRPSPELKPEELLLQPPCSVLYNVVINLYSLSQFSFQRLSILHV